MHTPLRLVLATATAADSTHVQQADFNGDGTGDAAFSASTAYVNGKKGAGLLVVLYGNATGVSSAKRSTISQNSAGVPGTAESGDHFANDLAYADFNGDGYDDLAVGSAGEDVGSDVDGGTVTILWGSASGLTGKGASVPDPAPTSHDFWGRSLAAGDFDGDGRADLAVSGTTATVHVFKDGFSTSGTAGGRYTVKPPVIGTGGLGPVNLTAGDVNGDGRSDLVVDGYETSTANGWNRNYFVPGTASGLSTSAARTLKPGVITAIGDIDADGYGDMTYGSASGPAQVTGITQDTGNVPGTSETGDDFGFELDLGDINGDKYLDLVVGVAGENIGGAADTGAVTILYGGSGGLSTASGTQTFAQSTAGVPGSDEKGDMFGADVKLDDVTGDGRADLLVGSLENGADGAVTYLPSNGTKITTTGSRTISPNSSGVSTTGAPYFGANFAD
ncbi:VCBS repeat-containing protein [Streptomyces cylindrosporus]|uniref:VCBS repeat-containing protein n=1 Tax=Streptomyces cylindrosporus TaxID=2927583 RepID=A0ABS9YCK4_9ACTN|nr:VCBS repeat-containing protein [Streptomyces cylindrosporus]MCI3274959.1 VCBS repeat-containing protein [Streptomyces cylindrosporus]